MGKRIISCVIAFCLILSGITFESREEINAAVTVTESHLYSVCPAYLNNETANNREAIARNAISKALSQISATDEFCAAYVLGLQKGEKILLNSFLSTCGISESMYDQKVDDAVTLLMDKFLCRNKNASEEAKSISTKYNKYLKKAFDLYDATSREEYISALQEANDKLDADAARDIVDEIMKDSSLKEIKKYVGDGIELWYLAANFVELQEIELETVDELISICVSNTATCGTDLHEGLLRYREEITNNIGEYFANNWLKDKIIEKVYNSIKKAGTKDFLSLPSSEKLAASLMVEVVAWAYEQNHPSANQIIEALIFQNFVISSGNAVNAVWYNLRLADSENYNKDTLKKQYILAHDLYYTAIQCSLNTAKKCTQDQGWKDVCSKYENAFRNTWTYSEYISLCLKDAQDDVNNGILVISTSNSTTTASGGKQSTNDNYLESIQAKFNEVKAHYPVESTWNGNWAGAIQCFGFARMVFSKLYGCEMSYRYKASAKYEYDDLTNVVMKGQLTGSNVTVENLKTLMAQGQLGDIVQAAGSSASQHTMVFEACTDSGILVYDCNSHLSGHNDADCTIHEWTIPWSSLVSWYGSGGISLYHAKNYESIYGDGSGLFYDDTVNFVIDENGVLTKYNGWQSFVEIPDTVTSIGDSAFKGNKTMVSVTIPVSVKSIGNYAFENCTALAAAVIPDSVENIGNSAFSGCSSMETVKLPQNRKYTLISENLFYRCTSLCKISIPENITMIGNGAFANCSQLEHIEIPNSVTAIGSSYYVTGAFANCTSLKDVVLPSRLTFLGEGTFRGCECLTEMTIPKTVTGTGYYAGVFSGCTKLKKIKFEEGMTKIPEKILMNCEYVEEIIIPDTITSIGDNAFYGCISMNSIILPQSLTHIGNGSFACWNNMEHIEIPNSVTTIGSSYYVTGAFANCTSLKDVVLPPRLTFLGEGTFRGCESLTEMTIPKTVTGTGYYAGVFSGCTKLKKIKFEEGMATIPEKMLMYCECVEEIEIPDSTTAIGNNAFGGCSSLQTIEIPNSVKVIGKSTFSNCTNLKSVKLPSELQSISSGMFSRCNSLKNIIIPDQVEIIDGGAFYDCTSLCEINIPNSVKKIGGTVFQNCKVLKSISIPNTTTEIGAAVFDSCEELETISLGSGLTIIPENGFSNCSKLKSIVIPYNVITIKKDAFINDTSLISITIPRKTTSIASNAFSYLDRMTIYGVTGTYAQTYASDKGINFVAQDVPATSIVLNESSLTLNKYNSAQLEARIAPANFTDEVVWSSSDTNVATVDQTGYVYAKQGGVTTITATAGNVSASCVVTVDQKISSIYFDDYSVSINIGEQKQLSVQIYPYDATNKDIEYKSLNENIATVNSNGVVTGIAEGTAEIKAIAKDGSEKWDSCYVYVSSSYSDDDNYEDNDHDDNYDDNMNNDNSNSGNESNNDNSSNNTSNTDSSNNSEGSATIRLEDCIAELSTTVFTYDGTEKCPVVTIRNGSTLLVQNIDYTVQYTNNINVGTATVIVVGKGRYTGTVLLNYSIIASTSDANSSTNVPKKGTKLVDPKYKLVYKITNSNKVKPKVEFIGTNNKKAKNISVPNTVKINGITYIVESVGAGALKNNKTVTSITIGNNVTKIKNDAFRGCTKLSKITIGKNVISLGNNVFYGCKKLSKIKINSTKMTAKTLSSKAFAGINKNTIIDVPNSKIKSYKTLFAKKGLPKNVKIK